MPGPNQLADVQDPTGLRLLQMPVTFRNLYSHPRAFAVFVLATVSLLCFLPVLMWGPPTDSPDRAHHVQLVNAFFTSFQNGTVLPDWVYPENGGYGSVTVRFYPPLFHVSAALFQLVLRRMDWAIFAASTFWSLIGCWGIYLWLKDLVGGRFAPLTGAIMFALSPYHLNQFYNSFLLGEFVSLSVLPFAFLFIRRVCNDGGAKNVVGLTSAISALVLSNIPQAVVCFPFLGLYALTCLERGRTFRQAAMLVVSGILSAACTAFYWVRVVAEMSWIHVSEPNTDPNYDFRNNFLFSSTDVVGEGIGFASIMVALLVMIVCVLLFVSGKYKSVIGDRQMIGPIAMFILSIFMLLPFSRFVWEAFDLLQRVQFPWRFLAVVSLTASILMAYAMTAITSELMQKNRPIVLIMIGCVFILATFSIKQVILGASYSETGAFNKLADDAVSGEGLYHWWPVWANKNTFDERQQVLADGRQVEIDRWDREAREFSVSSGEPATVRTAILYYPWWRVEVNGIEVATKDLGGALAFDIGRKNSACTVTFSEPSYTGISRGVSAISILCVILSFGAASFRKQFSYE